MAFVLDNSVVTGWYLPSQATPYSEAIAVLLETDKAIVPPLWELEVANVLKTACTKGRLTPEQARQILDTSCQLPIEIDTGTAPDEYQLLELAIQYQLSSYDAAYLELALRYALPLATQDVQLQRAAVAAGITLCA